MFNVTVLKMRDIIKYIVGIIIAIFIIVYTARFCSSLKNTKKEENKIKVNLKSISANQFIKCLDKTIPVMSNINNEYSKDEKQKGKITDNNYLEEFLQTEISSIKGMEKIENNNQEKSKNEENQKTEDKKDEDTTQKTSENITPAQTSNIKTEVVTQNPISENFNVQYKNVKIKNQTKYNLTEEMMTPDIKIDNKNILIFHTHSCESYTSSEKYQYQSTGNYRTTDLNYTVTRVGTELENYLKQYNINVTHDTSYHDYPSYTGSYTRSLKTVENMLQTTPADIIIDLHRDAVGSRSDYAPTVKIGDDYAAQIMFVIGTNEGGLYHPNWNENLKFAIKIQEKAEEMYPGLFKPIMLTPSRYNQHTGKYANIMEVGATGNTLEQCLTSMKYLSAVINEALGTD